MTHDKEGGYVIASVRSLDVRPVVGGFVCDGEGRVSFPMLWNFFLRDSPLVLN